MKCTRLNRCGVGNAWVALFSISVLLGSLLLVACGASESHSDGREPYDPPSKSTRYIYDRQNEDSSHEAFSAGITGEITLNGHDYWIASIGDPNMSDGLPMNEAYLTYDDPKKIDIGGGKAYSSQIPMADPSTPLVEVELEQPVRVNLDIPVGKPVTMTESGEMLVAGMPVQAEASATYEITETGVSVETAMGIVHDTQQYSASLTFTSPDLPSSLSGMTLTSDFWYSDSLGIVAAIIRRPPYPDVVFGLKGSEDMGEPGRIQKLSVLDAGNPSFTLSTYDVNGAFDADKNTHAKMMLELRYADESMAKTANQPQCVPEFGTAWGYFPSMLVESPFSFFHPQENNQGYTYWIAYVDQAAKNEMENGILYRVSVTCSDAAAVRATARILYKLYQP